MGGVFEISVDGDLFRATLKFPIYQEGFCDLK